MDSWRKITSNKTILAWIEFGVSYEFVDGPPPPTSGIEYNISEELAAVRDEEFRRYLELGAIEPLPQDQLASATFNGVFVVSQRNKDRPVIDQRYPNSYQKKIHFKMDTIRDVKDLLREGDFMFKIDLKDAYLHLMYRRSHRKYGAFWWNGTPWAFGMMFGHTHAPRWWTKLMKPVVKFLRKEGIRCVIYLDDLLVLCGKDFKEALRIRDLVLNLILVLGLTVNMKKSVLVPVRRLDYLGFVINSKSMVLSIDKEKIATFKKDVKKLLKAGVASARDLARILGKISAMSNAILPWRLRT